MVATLQSLDGAPLAWPDLKAMNEAYWTWQQHEESPVLRGGIFRHVDVLAIRLAHEDGMSVASIAVLFNCDTGSISGILHGKSHANVV